MRLGGQTLTHYDLGGFRTGVQQKRGFNPCKSVRNLEAYSEVWGMNPACTAISTLQVAIGQQWFSVLRSILGFYAAVWDPRPDLARPARSVRIPYIWWW